MVNRQIPTNTGLCCPAKLCWIVYWRIWAGTAEGEKQKGAAPVPVLQRGFLNYFNEDNPNGGVILTLETKW